MIGTRVFTSFVRGECLRNDVGRWLFRFGYPITRRSQIADYYSNILERS